MLTPEELQRAIQSMVDDWKPTYPTPWPLLRWLDEIRTSTGGGVSLWGKFIGSILQSPEWVEWFYQTAMFIARQAWGEAMCLEEIERVYSSRAGEEATPNNRWLHEQDDRLISLMKQYWFPDWQPPAGKKLFFPTKGITPQQAHAPVKDVFR